MCWMQQGIRADRPQHQHSGITGQERPHTGLCSQEGREPQTSRHLPHWSWRLFHFLALLRRYNIFGFLHTFLSISLAYLMFATKADSCFYFRYQNSHSTLTRLVVGRAMDGLFTGRECQPSVHSHYPMSLPLTPRSLRFATLKL